jgi:nucleotide-binding universal stress UspA family protein
VTTVLCEGSAAKHLVERSRSGAFDLIVMGSRGHGRLHTSLLGCVSQKVLSCSSVPVLLIRAPQEERAARTSPRPRVESALDVTPVVG